MKDKEKIREKSKRWRLRHPEKEKANMRRGHLRRKFGITEADFQKMVIDQHGKCAICGVEPNLLNIDHDHKTGKIRGLLCKVCNLHLGQFEKWKFSYEKYLLGV